MKRIYDSILRVNGYHGNGINLYQNISAGTRQNS